MADDEEQRRAVLIARIIVRKRGVDPDSDVAVLARQFLRAEEELKALRRG